MSLSALTTLLLVSVTSPGDGQGLLRGVIFEAESARPLANAQIQVAGRPLRSSKNGAFKVRLPAGKYPMSVKVDRKDGSSAVFMTQEVTVRKNAVTEVLLNVPMEGKGAFSVDVEEAGERAPPGAWVATECRILQSRTKPF